ncbi:MAG: LPP20 family lipoprotein [Bacteroidota bacterium]|nr:LPP20 family lipoprotein [Bacteroidota bacterium]
MQKVFLIIIAFSLVLLSSCGVLKNSQKPKGPKPEWVDKRPSSGFHYIGIGSARKAGLSPDAYKENARNSALNVLSKEISVNISSNSVINTIETDYQLSETYERQIQTSSDRNIEGYEVVDTWDGGDIFWMYCRLSKAEYQAQKAKKKTAALQQAKTKYLQANELRSKGKQYEAIDSYVEAFSDITDYLAEPTDVLIDSNRVDLGTNVYRDLIQSINEIRFESKENPVFVTSGMHVASDLMEIRITNKSGNPVPNMPVVLSFSGSGLLNNKLTSDQNGVIHVPINKVTSKNQMETLTVELNMVTLSRLTKDIFIRTVIQKMPPPTFKLVINVQSPLIFIESSEKDFGESSKQSNLKSALFQAMAKNNMRISNSVSEADFVIRIESDTHNAEASSYQKSVSLQYLVSVFDSDKRLVYTKSEKEIMGYGNSLHEASNEAYTEGINRMKRKTANSIFQAVFN